MKSALRSLLIPLTLLPASSFGSPSAMPPLTLQDAVTEALRGSPKLEHAKAAFEEQKWKKTETLSGFLPTVQITGNRFFAKRFQYNDISLAPGAPLAHVPLIFPTTSAVLSASIPIFDGFQNVRRYSAASLSSDAAQNESDWNEFQISEEVRLQFAEALTAQKLEAVAEQNVETLTDHLDQVNKTRKGGMATQYDVLRVEVQLNEARSELLKSKDDVILSRQKLLLVIGKSAAEDLREVSGELEIPDAAAVQKLKFEARSERKDLIALGMRADAANRNELAASAYWVPKISLGAEYILYNNLTDGLSDWDQYRAAWNAGVFVTWNLFDGMTSISRSKQAIYQKIQVEKQLEGARLQAPNDFEFWKRRYLYSAALYDAKLSDVKKGEESVRLAKAAMNAGVRTNSEVLDAELDLFRARAGLVNSLRGSAEAKIKLELAVGKLIPTRLNSPTATRF